MLELSTNILEKDEYFIRNTKYTGKNETIDSGMHSTLGVLDRRTGYLEMISLFFSDVIYETFSRMWRNVKYVEINFS